MAMEQSPGRFHRGVALQGCDPRGASAVENLFDQGSLPDPRLPCEEQERGRAGLLRVEMLLDFSDLMIATDEPPAENLSDAILDAESFHELIGATLPKTRLTLERSHHNTLEIRRHLSAVRCGGRHPPLELPFDYLAHRAPGERVLSGERLVGHHTDGVEIAANARWRAIPQLGRGVAWRARHHVRSAWGTHPCVCELHDATGAE